jgi:spore coat protein JB
MRREQLDMLKQVQALEFVALELNLYLDTHPDDQRALVDYNNTIGELQKLRQDYTHCYGPLIPTDQSQQGCWRWIEEPWPWEIEY